MPYQTAYPLEKNVSRLAGAGHSREEIKDLRVQTRHQLPPEAGEFRGRSEWDHEAARPGGQVNQVDPSQAPSHPKFVTEDLQYQNLTSMVDDRNTQPSARIQMTDMNHHQITEPQTAYPPSHLDPNCIPDDRFVEALIEKNIP